MKRLQELFKTYFATGLLVIVPLLVSIWLVKSTVEWVDDIFAINEWSPVVVPGLGLVLALGVILIAGMIGRNVIGSWLVANFSELVKKVPVIGSVYGGVRQTLQSLFGGGEKKFGKAVLVEYPRAGSWTIGLVTSERVPPVIRDALGREMMSVYIPTTPNPTSGFLLFVPKEETKSLNIKVDEALKLIVSLGLVESSSELSQKKNGN